MKWVEKHSKIIVEIISYLFILLFVYAAISKTMDFEIFRIQLGQSPLLTAFASWVSWSVPMMELLIALFLIFQKTRFLGLFAAIMLMAMFTTYIFIILNYSDYVPCSCGGVLEKLGWTEHLIFNIVFTILGSLGILLINKGKILLTLLSIVGSIMVVIVLFLISEDMVHYQNNFTRRFPPHPIKKTGTMDLGFNSYYLAGMDKNTIYLGNRTAPLHLLAVDRTLKDSSHIQIELTDRYLPFKSVKVYVEPPFFYVADGSVPCIFKGDVGKWKAALIMKDKVYFSLLQPLNNISFAFRARSSQTNENILGSLTIKDSSIVTLYNNMLEKQIDGVFCTDGMMITNKELHKIIYTYYYRNQFMTTDYNFKNVHYQNTIDTNIHAKLQLVSVQGQNQTKLATPPLKVNKKSISSGNYLYVNSTIMGRHEVKELWGQASIIDVYDLSDASYRFSFYIDHVNKNKLSEFLVDKDTIVALIGSKLITYQIKESYRSGKEDNLRNPDAL